MDDFERTECADKVFAAIGRALTLATRFEASCRGLSAILRVKGPSNNILDSEQSLKQFSAKLYRMDLGQHIKYLAPSENKLWQLLNRARIARNEIAHEITLGLDGQSGLAESENDRISRLRKLSHVIAEADRALCFALTVITGDYLPNNDILREYPNKATEWVCEL